MLYMFSGEQDVLMKHHAPVKDYFLESLIHLAVKTKD